MSSSDSRSPSAATHRLSVAHRVSLATVGTVVAVVLVMVTMVSMSTDDGLLEAGRDRLRTIVELQGGQLAAHAASIEADMRLMASDPVTVEALSPQGNHVGAGSGIEPSFAQFARQSGLDVIHLMNAQGDVVHSSNGQAGPAAGASRDSGLARAFDAARIGSDRVSFTDLAAFPPVVDGPAGFVSAPVLDGDGRFRGALVARLAPDGIDAILSQTAATAETRLVGRDLPSGQNGQASGFGSPDNPAVRAALAGRSGTVSVSDATGRTFEIAYAPVEWNGARLALTAAMSREVMLAPAVELRNRLTIAGLLIVTLAAATIWFLSRSILAPLSRIANAAGRISQGEATTIRSTDRRDEIGDIERALAIINEGTVSALRLRSALDTCQTNVMVADADYDIVYLNRTLQEMLRNAEADIRTELAGFDAGNLLGRNIDLFHKDPARQRAMLDKLDTTYRTRISVGGRTFEFVANPVTGSAGERLGTVVEWADRTGILAREAEERRLQVEMRRVKCALDSCRTNVMVADANFDIVYLNERVRSMLERAQTDIRKELPDFDSRDLLGRNIDCFHKNPGHQRRMLAKLDSSYQTEIEVGGRTFRLAASPVLDDAGERLGTVVEWDDRTNEIAIEREIDGVVEGAVDGDFSRRISVENKEGFHKNLAICMNALCDRIDQVTNDLGRVLAALSRGDLTTQIENDYKGRFGEIREHTNTTVAQLASIVKAIKESTGEIDNSVNEIAAGTEDLAGRTEQQASNLEETAASMEEMAATVKQNAENAQQANQLTGNTNSLAARGGNVVEEAVEAMASIEESSQKISDIIGVIDEIAFQTNLLALNAAVEAARAGEAGKGFAVVASEVRTLAQRSSQAARDIKSLISDSSGEVRRGVKLVNDTGDALREIVTSVARVADIVGEITAASSEQANGIGEINSAVSQMDEMTQQNSALVEENTASARALADLAGRLNEMVGFFSIDEADVIAPARAAVVPAVPARPSPRPAKQPPALREPVSADDDWQEF